MSIYTDLITSEHDKRPKFVATVAASTEAQLDQQAVTTGFPNGFDLETALGAQLDIVGKWIGISRYIAVPIPGVYFSWDTAGLGWDEGVWIGPFDPTEGLTILDDVSYRLLLMAKIGANHWDGTIIGAKAVYETLFPLNIVHIEDNQDMTITVSVTGPPLTPLQTALLSGGYLALKPVGVAVDYV